MQILNKLLLISIVGLLLCPGQAHAGRKNSIFTLETQTLNLGDFEFEEWIWGKIGIPNSQSSIGWIWFAPVYGLTRHIEIAFPWEIAMSGSKTSLTDVALDTHIILYDRIENTERLVWPMLRLLYQLNFDHPSNLGRPLVPWLGANVVLAIGDPLATHANLDLGYFGDAALATQQLRYHTFGLSYIYTLIEKELNLGAEYYHEISLNSRFDSGRRFFLGPSLSFARSQVWITFGVLRGLTSQSPRYQSRLMMGVNI